MTKIAFIVVRLVLESETIDNESIEEEINKGTTIPYCKQIEKVTVLECEQL